MLSNVHFCLKIQATFIFKFCDSPCFLHFNKSGLILNVKTRNYYLKACFAFVVVRCAYFVLFCLHFALRTLDPLKLCPCDRNGKWPLWLK